MLAALSILSVGIGSLLAAWVLPMLSNNLPHWLQIALLALGMVLICVGAVLAISERSNRGHISVKMRDGNHVGQIGDQVER